MVWLAKTVNDRLNVVETLRFQTVKKRFACVSVDMKNAVTTVLTWTRNVNIGVSVSNETSHIITEMTESKIRPTEGINGKVTVLFQKHYKLLADTNIWKQCFILTVAAKDSSEMLW